MNKTGSLRAHLEAAIPQLRHRKDSLLVFLDNGSLRCTAAPGLSFEYQYDLNVVLTDFAGHPDAVMIPLLAWVGIHQRELLENLDKANGSIKFEAEILSNKSVDLSITLPLTERVIVKKQADGTLQVTHPDEPQPEPYLEARHWQLIANGEPLADWESPEAPA